MFLVKFLPGPQLHKRKMDSIQNCPFTQPACFAPQNSFLRKTNKPDTGEPSVIKNVVDVRTAAGDTSVETDVNSEELVRRVS